MLVECLPLYTLYLAFRAAIVEVSNPQAQFEAMVAVGVIQKDELQKLTVYENLATVKCNEKAMWKPMDRDICVEKEMQPLPKYFHHTSSSIPVAANYGLLLLVSSYVCCGLCGITRHCGALCSFGNGKYLKYTWDFEETTAIRIIRRLLMVVVVVLLLSAIAVTVGLPGVGCFSAIQYVVYRFGVEACIIFFSIVKLNGEPPKINYQAAEFNELRFVRNWMDLFSVSNDMFGVTLLREAYESRCDSPGTTDLSTLLPDPIQQKSFRSLMHSPKSSLAVTPTTDESKV